MKINMVSILTSVEYSCCDAIRWSQNSSKHNMLKETRSSSLTATAKPKNQIKKKKTLLRTRKHEEDLDLPEVRIWENKIKIWSVQTNSRGQRSTCRTKKFLKNFKIHKQSRKTYSFASLDRHTRKKQPLPNLFSSCCIILLDHIYINI